MSSIFVFAECHVWGSNGQCEAYLDGLLEQSRSRYGDDDAFTVFFLRWREQYPLMGARIALDDLLINRECCHRFALIAAATSALLAEEFSGYLHGTHWLEVEMAGLIARVRQAAEL